ncbi:hypothetical protein SCP_1900820 [Sparassis crispa]|uniref:peptidylprolyl isomerase n=1 Tax=Sparassis crispa TaxID=139825 RepID=A0A401H778_9APHY|nr:hypothetical protein SCP_1900820 [Sparassis crispa]GBE90233.1 hypothetical protein SCP_1900820 [Sparassis crispa]
MPTITVTQAGAIHTEFSPVDALSPGGSSRLAPPAFQLQNPLLPPNLKGDKFAKIGKGSKMGKRSQMEKVRKIEKEVDPATAASLPSPSTIPGMLQLPGSVPVSLTPTVEYNMGLGRHANATNQPYQTEDGYVACPSGIRFKDCREGSGVAVVKGNVVKLLYVGMLMDQTIFDSNEGKVPLQFTVGAGQIMAGVDEGVLGMKVTGQRLILIPSVLAFGAQGNAKVPPNADVAFRAYGERVIRGVKLAWLWGGHMSCNHPHQDEIKVIIGELRHQAADLQKLRELLIRLIRSSRGYMDVIRKAVESCAERVNCDDGHSKVVYELVYKLRHTEESLRRLDWKITELEALLAPMQCLPDALLLAIFKAGCRQRRPQPDVWSPFPMLVASVSRRWRNLSLTTPTLWTNLHISMEGPRHWASLALTRSAMHLLDITIDGRGECPSRLDEIATYGHAEAPRCTPTIISCLNLLVPHSNRWRKFIIISHHSIDIRVVGEIIKNVQSPFLEHLRLSLTGSGPADNQEVPLPAILGGGAPMLSSVRLDSVSLPWGSMPLSGLSTIDIRWMWDQTKLMYPQFRDLLQDSPALEQLILRGRHVELHPNSTYESIHVPSLRYLELSGDNICRLSSILITPELETLALVNVDESEFREFVGWLLSVEIRYSALRFLVFVNVTTCGLPSGFTEAFPNIVQLTIINSHANHFIELMLRTHGSMCPDPDKGIWPLLNTIALIADDVNYDRLRQMLLKRTAQQLPVQRLVLNGIYTYNHQYVSPLMDLVKVNGISALEGDL